MIAATAKAGELGPLVVLPWDLSDDLFGTKVLGDLRLQKILICSGLADRSCGRVLISHYLTFPGTEAPPDACACQAAPSKISVRRQQRIEKPDRNKNQSEKEAKGRITRDLFFNRVDARNKG